MILSKMSGFRFKVQGSRFKGYNLVIAVPRVRVKGSGLRFQPGTVNGEPLDPSAT